MSHVSSRKEDKYEWCKNNGIYVQQDEVVELIKNGAKQLIIVDSRDDDAVGGKVKGSIHIPDGSWSERKGELIAAINSHPKIEEVLVIFHCMESIMRGPRCAARLLEHYNPVPLSSEKQAPCPRVRVLIGGADRWMRRFHADSSLVEEFDNDYWGFGFGEAGAQEEEAEEEEEVDCAQKADSRVVGVCDEEKAGAAGDGSGQARCGVGEGTGAGEKDAPAPKVQKIYHKLYTDEYKPQK